VKPVFIYFIVTHFFAVIVIVQRCKTCIRLSHRLFVVMVIVCQPMTAEQTALKGTLPPLAQLPFHPPCLIFLSQQAQALVIGR